VIEMFIQKSSLRGSWYWCPLNWLHTEKLWRTTSRDVRYRDVQILKFLSPRESADFDQGSAVSQRPQQKRK